MDWRDACHSILFHAEPFGKKEGIDFKHNKWILFIVLAAVAGAVSGLYDKYLMKQLNPMLVQRGIMSTKSLSCAPLSCCCGTQAKRKYQFRWDWTIICISIFLVRQTLSIFMP